MYKKFSIFICPLVFTLFFSGCGYRLASTPITNPGAPTTAIVKTASIQDVVLHSDHWDSRVKKRSENELRKSLITKMSEAGIPSLNQDSGLLLSLTVHETRKNGTKNGILNLAKTLLLHLPSIGAIAVPLNHDANIVASLVVTNRSGVTRTYTAETDARYSYYFWTLRPSNHTPHYEELYPEIISSLINKMLNDNEIMLGG